MKANNLKYKTLDIGAGDNGTVSRDLMVRTGYGGLRGTESDDEAFLRHQRLIALVDRREQQKLTEKAFVYKPPSTHSSGGNPLDIPHDAVSEWFMASSAMTVLPGMQYGTDIMEMESDEIRDDNISTATGIEGGLLTLSIHVVEAEVVRAYLHWNGTVMRFFPDDVKDVFPFIFNMEYQGNAECLEGGADGFIQQMKETLR